MIEYEEGFVEWSHFGTYFRVYGELSAGTTPLVVLHGGPGSGFDNALAFRDLWIRYRRPVIFYDQCGCGRSVATGAVAWDIQLFVTELRHVCEHLGLQRPHLLGTSWGGMVAFEAAILDPRCFNSLTVVGSPYDSRRWTQMCSGLIERLPAGVRSALRRPSSRNALPYRTISPFRAHLQRIGWFVLGGKVGSLLCSILSRRRWADFLTDAVARLIFARRHQLRMAWPPLSIFLTLQRRKGRDAYGALWGADDFKPVGALRNWSVEDKLAGLDLPVLVVSGEFDQATPEEMSRLTSLLPDGRHICIGGVSHALALECPKHILAVVEGFLRSTGVDLH